MYPKNGTLNVEHMLRATPGSIPGSSTGTAERERGTAGILVRATLNVGEAKYSTIGSGILGSGTSVEAQVPI